MFLKICMSKIFFKSFQALVTGRKLFCYTHYSEFLCNRNITISRIFKKMFRSTQKQTWIDTL